MYYSDKVILTAQAGSLDAIGNTIKTSTSRTVWANEGNIAQREFFEAARSGFKPEVMLTIKLKSYNGERIATYNGVTYHIYRTWKKGAEDIELYLTTKAVDET